MGDFGPPIQRSTMIDSKKKVKICKSCGKRVCECGKKEYITKTYKVTKEK